MKHVQVRLEDAEYLALRKRQEERGMESVQAAAREAVLAWCAGGTSDGPFNDLKAKEEKLLAGILVLLRDGSEETAPYRKVVEALAKLKTA